MSGVQPLESPIVRFDRELAPPSWTPAAADALLRRGVKHLLALCHKDYRPWLSERDLHGMLYTILCNELSTEARPAHALHLGYPCRLPVQHENELHRRTRMVPVDLILVEPDSIHLKRGRRWGAQLVAAVEVKRGYERLREIQCDLAKLEAIRSAWPEVLVYLVVMGYRNQERHIAAVQRFAEAAGVTFLGDNYWGDDLSVRQPDLAQPR